MVEPKQAKHTSRRMCFHLDVFRCLFILLIAGSITLGYIWVSDRNTKICGINGSIDGIQSTASEYVCYKSTENLTWTSNHGYTRSDTGFIYWRVPR